MKGLDTISKVYKFKNFNIERIGYSVCVYPKVKLNKLLQELPTKKHWICLIDKVLLSNYKENEKIPYYEIVIYKNENVVSTAWVVNEHLRKEYKQYDII